MPTSGALDLVAKAGQGKGSFSGVYGGLHIERPVSEYQGFICLYTICICGIRLDLRRCPEIGILRIEVFCKTP